MAGEPHKKAQGQIDKLKKELEANFRLEAAFAVCLELGIDDPIHWMNNTSPVLLDWWVAFKSLKYEREMEAYESRNGSKPMTPDAAGDYLHKMVGNV